MVIRALEFPVRVRALMQVCFCEQSIQGSER